LGALLVAKNATTLDDANHSSSKESNHFSWIDYFVRW